MRIITNGEKYAVAKYRWIFTKVLSPYGIWYNINDFDSHYFRCWNTKEKAIQLMEHKKLKWWDVKDY